MHTYMYTTGCELGHKEASVSVERLCVTVDMVIDMCLLAAAFEVVLALIMRQPLLAGRFRRA